MRGASSMVKKVRMAIVTMVTRVDTAAAPTEKAVAGLSTLVICEVSLDDPSERYFCRCSRKTRRPSGPWPFLASLTSVGTCLPKCTAAVTSGSVNRYTRPARTRAPMRKTEQGGAPVTEAVAPQEARGRRHQQREEEGDDDVDDDVAQDPQPEDQRGVEVEQQNDRGDRHDDRPQRNAAPIRTPRKSRAPGLLGLRGHRDQLGSFGRRQAAVPQCGWSTCKHEIRCTRRSRRTNRRTRRAKRRNTG